MGHAGRPLDLECNTYFCGHYVHSFRICKRHLKWKCTQRAHLLDQGNICPAGILQEDIHQFKQARLINAMIRFDDQLDISIPNILQ